MVARRKLVAVRFSALAVHLTYEPTGRVVLPIPYPPRRRIFGIERPALPN